MSTVPAPELVRLPDGRALSFARFGAGCLDRSHMRANRVVVAFHGTPGSRLKFMPAHAAAANRGLQILAVDRWGYGDTAVPDDPGARTFAQFAQDIAQFTAALGLERFAVCGVSGGGPFAASVGAYLADRVDRVGLVAPVGLLASGPETPASAQRITLFHSLLFRHAGRQPTLVRAAFRFFRTLARRSPWAAIRLGMLRSGPSDLALLKDRATIDALAAMMCDGLRCGVEGPVTDLRLFPEPWALPATCQRGVGSGVRQLPRLRAWFGDHDGSVPLGGIERAVAAWPGAELVRVEKQGHFWLSSQFPIVLDWLRGETAG
ncbi:MAG: alpha/beta fold hydrolase [Hyphomicrobiaceae bacterium]